MTKPIFGDAETIRQIDPFQKLLDDGVAIPLDVMPCRFCGGELYASFDDTWVEGNEFGAGTINLDCIAEPDIDSDEWDEWIHHWTAAGKNKTAHHGAVEDAP